MSLAFSSQAIWNQLTIELTTEQFQRVMTQLQTLQTQDNTLVIRYIANTQITNIELKNELTVTSSLDYLQDFAEENNLSQKLKDMLESTQQSVGLGAIAESTQRMINQIRTSLNAKQISDIIRQTRIDVKHRNELVLEHIEGTVFDGIKLGNAGYNEELVKNIMNFAGKNTTGQDSETDGKQDNKTDSGLSLSALLGPLLIVAVLFIGGGTAQ